MQKRSEAQLLIYLLPGVGIIYAVHHLLTYLFTSVLQCKGCHSGQYGKPPRISYWLRQAAIYVVALTTMKMLVVLLFTVWPSLIEAGQWLLSWTGGRDAIQIILYVISFQYHVHLLTFISVMGLFPICMNILQFWLIDSIVKATSQEADLSTSRDQSADNEPLFRADHTEDDEEDAEPSRIGDLENQQSTRSHPRSINSKVSISDERKKSASRDSIGTNESFALAYPPSSGSSSVGSILSTRNPS